ncbi:MAG TPA: FAD-dependent oxidoreductase [Gemmatimonadota bacterium]|jgi:NADPH-dependent 2,4-dienoyl-CoA reductase/sulfur reductase-like enzyme
MGRRGPVRYLVAGGGVAGTLAAQEIRKGDPAGGIHIVGEEPGPLYNRTLLSKEFLLGADPGRIVLKDASFYERRGIELEAGTRVLAVDVARREARLSDGSLQPFEKLLLATGAEPVIPPLEGSQAEGVCVLRSLAHAAEIRQRAASADRAVCVGGGFIGVETACALVELGLAVDLIFLEPHPWAALLPEPIARLVTTRLVEGGVRLHPRTALAGFARERDALSGVRLAGGARLPARLAVLGLGARPAAAFLNGSGIPVARGVLTGPSLETGVPGVYAAGDVAEVAPADGGPPRLGGHWSTAQSQGRVAGANLGGRVPPLVHDAVPFFDTRVFDLELAFVGDPRPDRPFVLHGSLARRRCIAFFVSGERLVGTVHVNHPDGVPAAVDVVGSGRSVDPRALEEYGLAGPAPATRGVSS